MIRLSQNGVLPEGLGRAGAPHSPLGRIPALDGLRGAAIVAVVTIHSFMVATSPGANVVDHAANILIRLLGPLGVDLFFVLSGFLITSILDGRRSATHPFRTFYLRRVLRIAPLYYVYLLVIPVAFASLGAPGIGTVTTRLWNWFFTVNIAMSLPNSGQLGFLFSHLWSLSIEEHFYLLWPLVVLLSPRRHLAAVCVSLIILSLIWRTALTLGGHPALAWFLMPARMDGLAAGSWICLMRNRQPGIFTVLRKPWVLTLSFAALATMIVIVGGMLWSTNTGVYESHSTDLAGRRAEIVLSPFIGSMTFAVWVGLLTTADREYGPAWLKRGLLARMARYSYGMYLFHVPLVVILSQVIPPRFPVWGFDLPYQILIAAFVLAVSTLIGWVTWTLLENRILRYSPPYVYKPSDSALGHRLVA